MRYLPYAIRALWLFVSFTARSESPGMVYPTGSQAPKPATTWAYDRATDATGSAGDKASVHSPTVLDLGYPYGRGAVATLTLRHRNKDTFVYVELSKGHFGRSFQGGTVSVRFDQQPARQYPLSAAANGRANIVFIDADRAFIESIRRAKQLTLELRFAGQTGRQLVFPTAGLRWPW